MLHAEWADKDAFKKHIKSDYVKEFAKYIEEVCTYLPVCSLKRALPVKD
jgi:quinol monooxygenase YgiN